MAEFQGVGESEWNSKSLLCHFPTSNSWHEHTLSFPSFLLGRETTNILLLIMVLKQDVLMFTDAKCSVGMWGLEKSEKNHPTEEDKVCSFPPDWTEIAIRMDFSCFRILINYSPSSQEQIWFSLCYKSAGAQVSTVAVRGRERLKKRCLNEKNFLIL